VSDDKFVTVRIILEVELDVGDTTPSTEELVERAANEVDSDGWKDFLGSVSVSRPH